MTTVVFMEYKGLNGLAKQPKGTKKIPITLKYVRTIRLMH